MRRRVLPVPEDETVLGTVKKMHAEGVGSIVILNKTRDITGIFTERDLMTKVVASEMNPKITKVAEAMTQEPQTLSSEMPILTAFQLLQNSGFRHVPVVDDSQLVGILSVKDLHKRVCQFMERAVLGQD